MPSTVDVTSFTEQVKRELLEGRSFHFKNVKVPAGLFVLGGFFVVVGVVLAIFLDFQDNIGSFIGLIVIGALFLIPGFFALGGYVEVRPTQFEWKVIRKPRQIVFGDLQAYAMIKTMSTKGGTSYSCRVYTKSGKSKTITCSSLKSDRPLPKKMKTHEFVMSLMSAYLQQARVPRYTGPV